VKLFTLSHPEELCDPPNNLSEILSPILISSFTFTAPIGLQGNVLRHRDKTSKLSAFIAKTESMALDG
jgi:hypothetical protein